MYLWYNKINIKFIVLKIYKNMHHIKINQNRGIALVAILAVLTVLGIMASVFVVQMRMESKWW